MSVKKNILTKFNLKEFKLEKNKFRFVGAFIYSDLMLLMQDKLILK